MNFSSLKKPAASVGNDEPARVTMTLDSLLPGEEAEILAVRGEGALRGRLLDMGFISHTAVRMEKTAPFGDPVEVSLRGYTLTLRRADARLVEVRRSGRGAKR